MAALKRMDLAPGASRKRKHAVISSTSRSISTTHPVPFLVLLIFLACTQPLEAREVPDNDNLELTTEKVLIDLEDVTKSTTLEGRQVDARTGQLRSSLLDSLFRRQNSNVKESPQVDSRPNQIPKTKEQVKRLSPVILVPGYGGSRLEARLNKQRVKHYFCERHTGDWRNIWIDLKLMLPYMIDCLIDDFRLVFEARTNTTRNTQGVEIRVRSPEDLATVEYLTDIHLSSFGYFASIIRRLTQTFGYERGVNMRGAPYDFRKAPNELSDYFDQLRSTSEEMFSQSGDQPVSFVCHSMGCNNVLYFLQRQSQTWKDKHVRRVVSLAAPWGGSMQAVRATAFGDNLGLPYLFDEAELKIVQQSVPSTMYLYPSVRAFGQEPLIQTNTNPGESAAAAAAVVNDIEVEHAYTNKTINKRAAAAAAEPETYTAGDFRRFFEQIRHHDGYLMWLNTKDLLRSLEAPGVEVYNLYGKGHSTLARMEFDGEFPNSRERDVYTDGDGTVAVQSAAICREWTKEQKQPVTLREFYANHVEMMKDPEVLNAIEEIMAAKDMIDDK